MEDGIDFKSKIEADVLSGESLKSLVHATKPTREAFIEGLLYQRSILMLAADPGTGKSVLALQMAAQLSAGTPVFGQLHVPKPRTTLIIQAERDLDEVMERLKFMEGSFPIDYERLIIDKELQGINVMDSNHQKIAMKRIAFIFSKRPFEHAVFDPIYAMVSGGLSKDEPATLFTRFSSAIQTQFGCANTLIHHTNRGGRDEGGKRTEGDIYGSRWLEAHVTAAFLIRKRDREGTGTLWECAKNSHGNLLDKIELQFDPSSYLSFMPTNGDHITGIDRLMMYLRAAKKYNKTFTFDDMKVGALLSNARLRDIMTGQYIVDNLLVVNTIGRKKLYQWRGE